MADLDADEADLGLLLDGEATSEEEGDGPAPPPKITYKFETQKQQLDGDALPVRKVWLDAAVRRKAKVLADQKMFAQEMKLPPPEAFFFANMCK